VTEKVKGTTQVGPGKYSPTKAPTSQATPKPTPTPTPSSSGSTLIDKINKSLGDKGIKVPTTDVTGAVSLIDSIAQDRTKAILIGKMLKARGKTVGASAEAIKNLFISEPELAVIAGKAGDDYNKLISLLNEDFIPELGKKEAAPAFTGPSRNIYKYTDADIDLLIKSVYQEKAMRLPTTEELAKERAKVRPALEKGTVSTTKFVKNAKGVMEQVTVQEGGPTKEAVATSIEERLKQTNPDDIDRTARIGFSDWISQNAAGA
jgi:hypothetical protein